MPFTMRLRPQLKTAYLDASILAVIAVLPAVSHLLAFPIYQFEPMRLALFTALLLSCVGNGFVLAISMPLLAFLTSGHPVPPKLFLIQIELVANVGIFQWMLHRWPSRIWSFTVAATASVVVAKFVYYGLKYLAIRCSLLDGALVTTAWQHQAAVLLLVAGVGQIVWWVRRR